MNFYIDGSILKPTYSKKHKIGLTNKIPNVFNNKIKSNYYAGCSSLIINSLNEINGLLVNCLSPKEIFNGSSYIPEFQSAINSIRYSIDYKIKKIKIFYDYDMIENSIIYRKTKKNWKWKNNPFISKWLDEYDRAIDNNIQIKFYKIKSHSGIKWNVLTDKIAKQTIYKYYLNPQEFNDEYILFNNLDEFNKYYKSDVFSLNKNKIKLQEEFKNHINNDTLTLKICKNWIDNSGNPNIQDKDGWTALIWASFRGYLEIVQYLVEKGANLDIQTKNGNTALMMATCQCYLDIIQYLVQNGANINIKNNKKWSVLSTNNKKIKDYLISKKV